METEHGATRTVLLVGNWAIKFPTVCQGSWRQFLLGMVSNMDEKLWSGYDNRLLPVTYCAPGGIFLIMPRAITLKTDQDVEDHGVEQRFEGLRIAQDRNPGNFGYYKGELVCVDYAPVFNPKRSDERS